MKIKVLLLAGTMPMSRELNRILASDSEIELVAEANNAFDARDKIIEHKPDVMLLCDNIPRMPGIVFLEKLTPQYPLPTMVIAAEEKEWQAYDAGAKDFIPFDEEKKSDYSSLEFEMIPKRLKKTVFPEMEMPKHLSDNKVKEEKRDYSNKVIAIGASTGGTEAICTVLKELKPNLPGIVMVQHMPEGFTGMYAQRLDNECQVMVKEARTGDCVRVGEVLLAPGDKQMRLVKVNGIYQVECKPGPKVSGHCPSVDVLFNSVAKVAGADATGVLMTGMGRDGADGLLAMRQAGALTIGQDESTCVVYGMPKAAFDQGAVRFQLPLHQIAQKLYQIYK